MQRVRLCWGLMCSAVLPLSLGAQSAPAQASPVDTLIVAAGLPNVLSGFAGVVQTQLSRTAPSLPADRAARAAEVLARHFAADQLFRNVAVAFAAATPPERMGELYALVTTGPIADARRIASAYTPPLPIEEFAAGLAQIPPPEARVLLMLRLARAHGAGPLFLTLAEAARGAANTAARAIDPNLPAFRALPEAQVALALETHDQQSVLLYLYRYATLSDELVASVAERYESEAGRWYMETLARVVRDAVLTAAEGAATELRTGPRQWSVERGAKLDWVNGRGLYVPG